MLLASDARDQRNERHSQKPIQAIQKPIQAMITENNHGHSPTPNARADAGERCTGCGATLAEDQRYCLHCGARRGLPRLDFTAFWKPASSTGQRVSGSTVSTSGPQSSESTTSSSGRAPSRRMGALLVATVLAAGIVAGAALGPNPPNSPADSSTLAERALAALVASAGAARSAAPAPMPTSTTASGPTAAGTSAPAGTSAAAGTPAPEPPASSKDSTASASENPSSGGAGPENGSSEESSSKGSSKGSEAAPGTPIKLPPIKHVWLISLSGTSLLATAAKGQSDSYLAKQLLPKGALLSSYTLTAPSSLANGIAVLSGQGVNLDTEQNCPTYSELQPPTVNATGVAEGVGCVYPAPVQTLADELTAAGLTWKAYVQNMEGAQAGSPTAASPATPGATPTGAGTAPSTATSSPAGAASCRHPELGAPDPDQTPAAGAPYLTFRNPFVYFHSLLDGGACASDDVDFAHLQSDLAAPASTPNLSWIVPSACDDGSPTPCAPGAPAGLAPAESFLEEVVPWILATATYREGGLIVIVPDSGPGSPGSANAKPVGALLLSRFVHAGWRVSESVNDFTLLKSLSRLFGVLPLGHANDPSVASFGAAVYGSSGKAAKAASTAKKAAQAAPTTPPGG